MESMQIDKFRKPSRRRKDSVNKLPGEIEDIMSMLTFLDETKLLNKLPLFLSTDPDKMPSVKLTDGDLAVVLAKLSFMDQHIESLQKTVDQLYATVKTQESIIKAVNVSRNLSEIKKSDGPMRSQAPTASGNMPTVIP